MQEITKVALDAMGGDNAPVEIVKGAVNAVSSRKDLKVFLVGQEDVVKEELAKYSYPADQIEIVDAPEVTALCCQNRGDLCQLRGSIGQACILNDFPCQFGDLLICV